jgi:hypothetical protein
MKAKAVPEGTKTLEDERNENLDALEERAEVFEPDPEDFERQAPIDVLIQKTFKDGTMEREHVKDETVAVHGFITEPAIVGCGLGRTINLGAYESARLDVSIKVPCYREEAEEAFEFARRFVEDRLDRECEKVVEGRAKKARQKDPF